MAKYLNEDGLLYFWQKIKNLFALKSDVPTKVSELQNDAGYVTSAQAGTTYSFSEGNTDGAFNVTDNTTSTTSTINIHGLGSWAYRSAFRSSDIFSALQNGIVPKANMVMGGPYYLDSTASWSLPRDEQVKVVSSLTTAYLLGLPTSAGNLADSDVTSSAVANLNVYLAGGVNAGTLVASKFSGVGSALTSLNASNISSGTIGAARLPAASTTAQGAMSSADKVKLNGFSAASYYALKSDITGMYKYKGSVATASALPTTGQTTGDVYNIEAASTYGGAGMNVAWNGTAWDPLGEVFTITNISNGEIDTIVAS